MAGTRPPNHRWTLEDNIVMCVAYKQGRTAREAHALLGYTERELSVGSVKNKLSQCKYLDLGAVRGGLRSASREHIRAWLLLGYRIHG